MGETKPDFSKFFVIVSLIRALQGKTPAMERTSASGPQPGGLKPGAVYLMYENDDSIRPARIRLGGRMHPQDI